MAKPRPVPDLDPRRRVRPNARRILAVRIDEAWSYSAAVQAPGRVRELHDMRIAFKRLRYLIEIFAVAFEEDLDPFLDVIKELQDLLGDIHDCDVQIPMLQKHLAGLGERDAESIRLLLADPGAPAASGEDAEVAFRRFADRLDAATTADLRPGIHALLDRRTRDRTEIYARFILRWTELHETGFRVRLERALGVDRT